MTQPGNTLKAGPSHLTAVDTAFEGLSEGVTFEGRKGYSLRRMQPRNWDTATASTGVPSSQSASWCYVFPK